MATLDPKDDINIVELYEVASPSFADIMLDEQIRLGINNWVAVDRYGHEFFGRTANEAAGNLYNY